MKPNQPLSLCIGLVILVLLVSCREQPTPITNPPAVETSLASTALALAKQTETANPVTATPPPTSTTMPTPTPKISPNGTSLEVRGDQSALFTDHKLGFQLVIPAGWLPVRLNEDEYYQAFTLEAVSENPVIVDFLSKIQTLDGNHVRLVAIDLRPAEGTDGILSGISVILQPETVKTVDDWVRENPARANRRKAYVFLSSQYQETASGDRVLVREERWDSATGDKLYSMRVLFNLPAGVLTLDLETGFNTKDSLLPDFEQIVNSFTQLDTP